MDRARAINNFEIWKNTMCLPKSFPMLQPIPEDELEEKTFIPPGERGEWFEEINLRIGSTSSVFVIIPPGQGATTLYHYILRRLKITSLYRKFIPVPIDLQKILESAEPVTDLINDMKTGILKNLVTEQWEKATHKGRYLDIIDAYDKDPHFHKQTILKALSKNRIEWESEDMKKMCSLFSKSIQDILKEIYEKINLKIILFFDVPRTASFQQIKSNLVGTVKDLYDNQGVNTRHLSEVYFLTPSHYKNFKGSWPRADTQVVIFNGYAPFEVFQILSHHYQPSLHVVPPIEKERQNSSLPATIMQNVPLAVIVDPAFITEDICKGKDFPLTEIASRLEERLLEHLDCEQRDIPFTIRYQSNPKLDR